jgi:Trp operon repressor
MFTRPNLAGVDLATWAEQQALMARVKRLEELLKMHLSQGELDPPTLAEQEAQHEAEMERL